MPKKADLTPKQLKARQQAYRKYALKKKKEKKLAGKTLAQKFFPIPSPEQVKNLKGIKTSARPVNYLSNKNLLEQVILSKKQGKMTNELAKMFVLLCQKYAKKNNFVGYSYNDDMQGTALLQLVTSWQAFDEKKYSNAFAFYTQCIKNAFIQVINKETLHFDKVQMERQLAGADIIGFGEDSDEPPPTFSDDTLLKEEEPVNTE